MSYPEKKTITSITTGLLVLAAYCIYVWSRLNAGNLPQDDLKFWAVTMLVFIGIGVIATIIIQIVFHVLLSVSIAVQEKMMNADCSDKEVEKAVERSIGSEMVEDEMHKLIELKSSRVSIVFMGAGFVAGLVTLAFQVSPVIMLNILFAACSLGSIAEGFAQLRYYRRGL